MDLDQDDDDFFLDSDEFSDESEDTDDGPSEFCEGQAQSVQRRAGPVDDREHEPELQSKMKGMTLKNEVDLFEGEFSEDEEDSSDFLREEPVEADFDREHTQDEDDDEEYESAEGVDVDVIIRKGMYNADSYAHLDVTPDVKDLFKYIGQYQVVNYNLGTRFKPFVPDFIPAVGDIDAFIKVLRPDDKEEGLGLEVLDEPAANQSDRSLLDLQLRAMSRQTTKTEVAIKKVPSDARSIEKWIKDISDLHREKPPPTVHYHRPMPKIDDLMKEWPEEVESALRVTGLPTAAYDCDIKTYVDLVCSVLDIPVYKKSRIQSLHVLFTLFSAFKQSQHFNHPYAG